MIKTLIVSGGNYNKIFVKDFMKNNLFDIIIAVDKGLESLNELEIMPNHIVGDFDSIDKEILAKYANKKETQIHKFESEKDFTDTHLALQLAMDLNSTDIIILGGIGTRIDHTIANINILCETLEKNISCKIIDEFNQIQVINKPIKIKREYQYFSLIPLTTKVEGITLKGFKYPLNDATLEIGKSLGISNEQIEEESYIEIKKGILIVIQSKD